MLLTTITLVSGLVAFEPDRLVPLSDAEATLGYCASGFIALASDETSVRLHMVGTVTDLAMLVVNRLREETTDDERAGRILLYGRQFFAREGQLNDFINNGAEDCANIANKIRMEEARRG